MINRIFIVAAGLAALGASASAIVLDDFSTGNNNYSITAGSVLGFDSGTMVGGDRALLLSVTANQYGLGFFGDIADGVLSFNSQSGVDALGIFGYGYEFDGTGGALDDLELDLSGLTAFQLNIISRDAPTLVRLALRSSSGDGAFHHVDVNLTGTSINTPETVTFNFADFAAGIDFSDIDQIEVLLDMDIAGDIAVTSFEAVPEPATMLALGAGAALLAARRRRKA